MTFVSYAQNFEDVILWRALKDIRNGFYIDLGAAWPEVHSVTYAFYERGWSGINVEPNPLLWSQLQEMRRRDRNLQVAVGDCSGRALLSMIVGTGLSTLDVNIAGRHADAGWTAEQVEVPVITLVDLWASEVPSGQEVHFLKVDVEGSEEAALRSNDWNINRPWIVIVEATIPLSSEASHKVWEKILLDSDYILAYMDGLNRFYVAKEHEILLSAFSFPPNVFDEFTTIDLQQAISRADTAETFGKIQEDRAVRAERQLSDARRRADRAEKRVSDLKSNLSVLQFTLAETETTLAESESMAHALQVEIASVYNSLSWRMTMPLRRFNPRSSLVAARARGDRNTSLQVVDDRRQEEFVLLRFGGTLLRFAKAPLADSRGIGRVTRELLACLEHLADDVQVGPVVNEVDFYSTIHWCPPEPGGHVVAMIHDVIPLVVKDVFPASSINNWLTVHAPTAQKLQRIITISNSSADDIASILGISRERISVVPNGVSQLPVNEAAAVGLPARPFIVYLGSDDHHKNIAVVLQAMLDPSIADIDLVMIGDNKTDIVVAQIKILGLDARVHFLGRLADEDTGYVVQRALALVLPSFYEGFGLPPLEAALLGTPSVCSRRPAMTELLADAALFAEPDAPGEWANHIAYLMRDSEARDRLRFKARRVAEQFSWTRSAETFVSLLRELEPPLRV